jgi:hypothetical protein
MLQNLDMSNYNTASQFYIFYLFYLYSFRYLFFNIKIYFYYISIWNIEKKKREKFIGGKNRRKRKVSVNNILTKKILVSMNSF